jgi:small-conductance mechanosensitive channel
VTRRTTVYVAAALASGALATFLPPVLDTVVDTTYPVALAAARSLTALAVGFAVAAGYRLVVSLATSAEMDDPRQYRVKSVLRLAAIVVGGVAVLGVLTDRWIPALVSLGVAGVAVSFALQQPLLSLLGWVYVMTKRPYEVGDRVKIDDSVGDVLEVDYLVTTLLEVDSDLVDAYQPSGRHITVPNSDVVTSHVVNFTRREFPPVWNELAVQVSYETDLDFARDLLREEVRAYLGDEMAEGAAQFRREVGDRPVSVDVSDEPTVNVRQRESWVELRVRYLVDARQSQAVRNDLYERVLAELNDHPDRVSFPIGRSR